MVIAMQSSGLHSNGYSLVRHVCSTPPAGRWTGTCRPDPRRRAPRADPDLRQGLPRPGPEHPHPCDVPHHRGRPGRQPRAGDARGAGRHRRPRHLDPAAGLRPGRRVGSVPQEDLEKTLNCGVGMVSLTAADDADRAISLLEGHGVRAWVCGEVSAVSTPSRRRPAAPIAGGPAPRLGLTPAAAADPPYGDPQPRFVPNRAPDVQEPPVGRYRWTHENTNERPDARGLRP